MVQVMFNKHGQDILHCTSTDWQYRSTLGLKGYNQEVLLSIVAGAPMNYYCLSLLCARLPLEELMY